MVTSGSKGKLYLLLFIFFSRPVNVDTFTLSHWVECYTHWGICVCYMFTLISNVFQGERAHYL